MTCNEVRQHWMLYVDSEGDPELHFRLSDHLGMCPACAEWYAQQQRFEQALKERLAAAKATPELWQRVLTRAGIRRRPATRRRLLAWGGALAASLLLGGVGLFWIRGHAHAHDLPVVAVGWHEQLLHGNQQPDLQSTSDREVDQYLKKRVGFRVHCPPRNEANFAVQGAGVCTLKDEQAAYIVGQVGSSQVSILVLDRNSLDAFQLEKAYLERGRRHRCTEGDYQMISGVVADNVVVVIGTAPGDQLERLLNAYGSYHEGS